MDELIKAWEDIMKLMHNQALVSQELKEIESDLRMAKYKFTCMLSDYKADEEMNQ